MMISLVVSSVGLAFLVMAASTPQQIMSVILFQALLMVTYMAMVNPSLWVSYTLFLVFLGGLMVLFSYMMSLAPNFFPSLLHFPLDKSLLWGLFGLMGVGILLLLKEESTGAYEAKYDLINYTSGMFSFEGSWSYLYIVLYLLVSLLGVTWVVKFGEGPLRRMK